MTASEPPTSAFALPSDVADLVDATHAFVRDQVIPNEPAPGEHLDDATFAELRAAAKTAGVFAPQIPVDLGGRGVPLQHWSPVFQAAGYSANGPAILNCMAPDEGNMHMMNLIATPAQRERYLRPLAAGDVRSAFAMTEPHPGAGSDPNMLRTAAVKTDDGWVINGEKRFISGAYGAAFAIVMARTGGTEERPEATMFLVDTDQPGFEIRRPIQALERAIAGGHPYVALEDLRVADDAVLGAPGEGFRYAQVRLGPARLTHCMRWLGLARRALDTALDRVNSRELFGSRMSQLGLAQELIAQSVIDIETADALITRVGWDLVTDERSGIALSSVAKAHCAEAVFRVIDRAMQICGGDGVCDALPLAQYLNEVRPFRIYDGSTETHKWAIARRAARRRQQAVEAGEPFLAEAYGWDH